MKTALTFSLSLILIANIFSACKKSSDTPLAKGVLLDYYNDQPIAGAQIMVYHGTDVAAKADAIVYTDSNGNFVFPDYDYVTVVPFRSGWWMPFGHGYQMRVPGGGPIIEDSIIYLFHKKYAHVTVNVDSTFITYPRDSFLIQSDAYLPKLFPGNGFVNLFQLYQKPYTGEHAFYYIPVIDILSGVLTFSINEQNGWDFTQWSFTEISSETFNPLTDSLDFTFQYP